MKQFYHFFRILLFAVSILGYSPITEAQQAGDKFSFIILPDAQNYTSYLFGGSPSTFTAQTQWCVNSQATRNIKYVGMVGDLTNESMSWEWGNANTSMSKLDAVLPGIPFGVVPGNHDLVFGSSSFNTYFGVSRFEGRSYYGGHYGSTNDNHYDFFSSGGMDFIVICLGSGSQVPSTAVLDWADALLKSNPGKHGMLINHSLMYAGINSLFTSPGLAIYDALKDNPNLFMMICGHEYGSGYRTDTYNDHTIYTMIADYQDEPNGGNGWLRIAEFDPPNNLIHMTTYSPTLNSWKTGVNDQFDLIYDMQSTTLPLPEAFNVTGGGSYCMGSAGLPVGLSGSQTGVTYTLYKDGLAQAPVVAGTGNQIAFSNQTEGTYTVKGTNSAGTTDMTGSAVVIENECATLSVSVNVLNNGTVFKTSTPYTSTDPVIYITGKGGNFGLSSQVTMTAAASGGVGPYTYTWSPATGLKTTSGSIVTAKPSAAFTTYSVTVTDANGNTAMLEQTVTVNNIICGTTKKPGVTMCILSGSTRTSTCVLLTNTKVINNKNNTFGPCIAGVVIKGGTESVLKEAGDDTPLASIKAYPNPTNGNISLDLNGFPEGKASINLYCTDGSLAMQKELELSGDEQVTTLDLTTLSNGVYIVQIVCNQSTTQTMIIKH